MFVATFSSLLLGSKEQRRLAETGLMTVVDCTTTCSTDRRKEGQTRAKPKLSGLRPGPEPEALVLVIASGFDGCDTAVPPEYSGNQAIGCNLLEWIAGSGALSPSVRARLQFGHTSVALLAQATALHPMTFRRETRTAAKDLSACNLVLMLTHRCKKS